MRVLICDDEANYLEQLYIHINEYMNNHYIECDITTTQDPISVLNSDASFDLAFLDIQMAQIDGISLAKKLKQRNSEPNQ